jgi:hypothetical protein
MDGKQKVTRAWAIRYPSGQIHLWSMSHTRKHAVEMFCDNGPERSPDDWKDWQKRGLSAVKVEIREET